GVERLPAGAGVLPVAVPAFQLVAEKDLLRNREAQGRVLDLEVAHKRRGAEASSHLLVVSAGGGDLLCLYRLGKRVDRNVKRIEHARAVLRHEPQPSILRLRDLRNIASGVVAEPDAVGAVENGRLETPTGLFAPLRRGGPGVQLGAGDAHQAAGHVQPERAGVVLDSPVNGVAGQPVPAGQGGPATLCQPAEPAFGGGPERAIRIEAQGVDASLAQSVGSRVRRADLSLDLVHDSALLEPDPEAASDGIDGQGAPNVSSSQAGPRDLFDVTSRGQSSEAMILVGDPQVAARVLDHAV